MSVEIFGHPYQKKNRRIFDTQRCYSFDQSSNKQAARCGKDVSHVIFHCCFHEIYSGAVGSRAHTTRSSEMTK